MVEKNMVTLTERTIMKSRSGVYSDTAENRRKHRVGQKYGAEKQSDDGEKTEKKETDPAKELEAVNKVIAAINEGKLTLPNDQIMVLVEKKSKLEAAKKQAEKINAGVKANEEKKNAEEAKETSKKINEAQKKEAEKKEESSSKKYAEMDIKEAKKELLGKEITFKKYFFDGVDSYKDAVGKISQVRLYGKEKQPVLSADLPNGDSVQISLKQLDERKALKYEIGFNEKVGEDKTEKKESEKKEKPKNEDKSEPQKERVSLSGWEGNSFSDAKKSGTDISKIDVNVKGESEAELKKNWEALHEKLQKERGTALDSGNEKLKKQVDLKIRELNENYADKRIEITRKNQEKEEHKQGEVEESYTRVKFDDVPNSGKVNLKKYLSDKVRKGVDEKWSNIKNIPTENLKKMEKGLVNDLNKNFEAIKKSQRAELLYSIMKVKGELESRGKETQKKE